MDANRLSKIKRELVKVLSGIGLRSVRSNYEGMPLRVPIVHGIAPRGLMVADEFWMGKCLAAFIASREGAVIDIGVNIGLYLTKLRALSSDRPYVGFEPNPSCLLYVHELIRLNKFTNCKVFPYALFDKVSVARFYAGWHGDKTGTLVREFREGDRTDFSFDVLTAVGDDMAGTALPEDLCVIKIDVEEAELQVLKGLSRTIAEQRPYLYCEILHANGEPAKLEKGNEIFELLTQLNYRVLGLDLQTNTLEEIERFEDVGAQFKEEFIFCPEEWLASFCDALKCVPRKLA